MKKLNFRTARDAGRKPRLRYRKQQTQRLPKGFFVRRCPWTGYFYAKGGRDSKSNGKWGRSIRGMKWNCYLREGLKPLKDFRSDIMFLINLSIAWKLIKRWKVRGGVTPGMPLLEGIMGASSVRAHLPSLRRETTGRQQGSIEGRAVRAETELVSDPEPEGRPRIEATDRIRVTKGRRGMQISAKPTQRMDDGEERNVMWFPNMDVVPMLPENFVRDVRTEMLDVPSVKRPPRTRAAKVRKAKQVVAKAPEAQKCAAPKTRRKKVRIARFKRERLKRRTIGKAPKMLKKKPVKAAKVIRRAKPGLSVERKRQAEMPAPSLEIRVEQVVVAPWFYRKEHLPTIGWSQKRVRQLKVTRADDPNLPR